MAEKGGFEPPVRCYPYNGLANRRLQPLGHLSKPRIEDENRKFSPVGLIMPILHPSVKDYVQFNRFFRVFFYFWETKTTCCPPGQAIEWPRRVFAVTKRDYKKDFKELYLPKTVPVEVRVPAIKFIQVKGQGDPLGQEYQDAIQALYSLSFTIKMSKMSGQEPSGYFEYVVPPLEGLWGCKGDGTDWVQKRSEWLWCSMVRQPEFVTPQVFNWAVEECHKKKPQIDISKAQFETFEEGPCVQILHIGPYNDEALSLALLEEYIQAHHLQRKRDDSPFTHHEIYLSDPRKVAPEKLKTVLRIPVSPL